MSFPGAIEHKLKQFGHWLSGGASTYAPLTSNELDERFNGAVIVSVIVHIGLIFGLSFTTTNPALFRSLATLEVVLVNARSKSKPLEPTALAQHSMDGGGDVEDARQARSPLPASAQAAPPSANDEARLIEAVEDEDREALTQQRSDYAVLQARSESTEQPKPALPAPVSLAEASLEQARLMARISEQWDDYQKRPRRMFIGARVQEYSYARYLEDWRIKVERIGNLNYPEAAKQGRIHGTLILTVNIKSDGSLENVQIDRSSGSRILDAAALKIVQMAAPYAPFNEDMRKTADILSITRAWQFTTSDRLFSQ